MHKTLVAFGLSLALAPINLCQGDEWAAPSARIFASENGYKALKIVPDKPKEFAFWKAHSQATSFRLNADGKEQILHQFPLLNTPMQVLIPEQGINFFVTLDTYGHLGYDHTLVIYRSNGQVVRDFKLEDFLTEREIFEHIKRSVRSRWWREAASFAFEIPSTQTEQEVDGQKAIYVKSEPENAILVISFLWDKKVKIKLATGEILA